MKREAGRSLGEATYCALLEMLARPDYPPGTRLPSEPDLSRSLSVSRPILRQALGRLQSEGRVATRKGSGTVVLTPVAALTIPFGPLDSIPDVRAFLEFRCSLEGEIAAHAATQADRAAVAHIRQARRALDRQIVAAGVAINEDIAFHAAIASASRNRFFVATLGSLREQVGFGIRLTRELSQRPAAERFVDIRREHAAIEAAVTAGDAPAARDAMTAHLRGGIARLFGTAPP